MSVLDHTAAGVQGRMTHLARVPISAERLLRAAVGGADMEPESLHRLASSARFLTLPAGKVVWHQGEQPRHLLVIARGMVKVMRRLPNGNDVALGLFGPREAIGIVAAIDGVAYPAEAVVMSKSLELLAVPLPILHELLSVDAPLGRALLSCMASRVRQLHEKLAVVSSGSVEARLASLVLSLAARFGDETEDGATLIPIQLTRKTVAELVESRVETVIRQLSRWQQTKLIELGPGGMRVPTLSPLQALVDAG